MITTGYLTLEMGIDKISALLIEKLARMRYVTAPGQGNG
jgi:hypothetical protein